MVCYIPGGKNVLKLMNLEFYKMRKIIISFFVLCTIFSSILVFAFLHGYNYQYNVEIWSEAYTIILFFFPVFCTMPTAWLMYYERKNNFIIYSVIRTKSKKYFASKLVVHCIYGFIIMFVMSMSGLLLALYAISPVSGLPNPIGVFQLDFLLNHPFLYGLILSLWRSILALLFVAFGFMASLLFNNIFVILIALFIYYILKNIILSTLNFSYFRMITSLGVVTGDYTADILYWYLLVGPEL